MSERRYDQAAQTSERALAINAKDLTALSISAAANACLYDQQGLKRSAAAVAAVNPTCALFHRTVGDALSAA